MRTWKMRQYGIGKIFTYLICIKLILFFSSLSWALESECYKKDFVIKASNLWSLGSGLLMSKSKQLISKNLFSKSEIPVIENKIKNLEDELLGVNQMLLIQGRMEDTNDEFLDKSFVWGLQAEQTRLQKEVRYAYYELIGYIEEVILNHFSLSKLELENRTVEVNTDFDMASERIGRAVEDIDLVIEECELPKVDMKFSGTENGSFGMDSLKGYKIRLKFLYTPLQNIFSEPEPSSYHNL